MLASLLLGCLNSFRSVLEDTVLHSYSQGTFSPQVRYAGDFLSRLERDHWQKRINQLKYEFANSFESPSVAFDSAAREDDVYPSPVRPSIRHSATTQPLPQAEYWQAGGLVSKAPIARPIIRRDRPSSIPT